MRWSPKIAIAVSATVFGISILTATNNPTANQTDASQLTPIVKPLRLGNGVVVADLRCGEIYLRTAARLEKFSCTLKNNTDKPILAANVEYSIILESGGKKITDTRLHTLDTYVHPDLYEPNKAILPSGERNVEPPGPMYYEDSAVKAIEVKVDYVEFDDKSSEGDSQKAAEMIADIRGGAAKYRNWLIRKYAEHGRSAEALIPLLRQDLPVLTELGIKRENEEHGARAYKTRLRVIAETKGASEIHKRLSK